MTGGRRGETGGIEGNVMARRGRASVNPIIVFSVKDEGVPGPPSLLD